MFQPDTKCKAKVCISENHGERFSPVDMILLHYTGMKSGKAALDWLCNPESGVSCHYFVDEDGTITQLVPESRRAWHAGKSSWQGDQDINSRSIGIEIANPGHEFGYRAFPREQIRAVIELCLDCGKRLDILPHLFLAHSDVAPLRKEDPGELFPWKLLHEAGIGHWVDAEANGSGRYFQQGDQGQPVEALQSMLALYGYNIEISGVFDDVTTACVTAFQRHFRQQKVDGVADDLTIVTLYKLLAELPEYKAKPVS